MNQSKILSRIFVFVALLLFWPNHAPSHAVSSNLTTETDTILAELTEIEANKPISTPTERLINSPFESESNYTFWGDLWRPVLSFALPGFDQFCNGQYGWGAAYAGAYAGAYIWRQNVSDRKRQFEATDEYDDYTATDDGEWNLILHNNLYREYQFTYALRHSIRSFSAYHAFRSAVRRRQRFDEYTFLSTNYEETTQRLWAEPFNFSYLKRPTTWGYQLATASLLALEIYLGKDEIKSDPYTSDDATYTTGLSYLAGTGEEALYRGTLMPILRQYTGSYLTANVLQTAVFALSHGQPSIGHFVAGYYFGWQTKRNHWQIGESIFNHFWRNVISISATYLLKKTDDRPLAIMVPLIHVSF